MATTMKVPFYATAEEWIKTEWSWVRANIALHPYLSVGGAAFVANVIGVFLHI